jgi:hypothetical protein
VNWHVKRLYRGERFSLRRDIAAIPPLRAG